MPDPKSDPQPGLTPIHILTPGTHTDSRGTRVTFTAADLRAMADAYDPALHEAPVVVGHPRDDAPAYGWVERVDVGDDGATALAGQVDAGFADLWRDGRFKKVSAALYLPDSPVNPAPGSYYLRHVGVLGAQPPAIKGLKQTQFDDGEGYVTVELGEVSGFTAAGLFRGLRDWMIEQFGTDKADKALPGYLVDSLRDEAAMPPPAADAATPAYGETAGFRGERRVEPKADPGATGRADGDAPSGHEGPDKTAAIPSENDEGDVMAEDIAGREAALAERERALATLQAELTLRRRRDEAAAVIAAANQDGVRILPVDVPAMTALLARLDGAATDAAFGEGEDGGAADSRAWLERWLGRLPVQVDLGEYAAADGSAPPGDDAAAIAAAALAYQEKARQAGRSVRIDEAVRHVVTTA